MTLFKTKLFYFLLIYHHSSGNLKTYELNHEIKIYDYLL
jgi:hypothetical protein